MHFSDIKSLKWTVFAAVMFSVMFIIVTSRPLEWQEAPVKSILIWNSPNRLEMAKYFGAGTEAFVENGCQVTRCQIIRNRSTLPFESYDAVVMNMLEIYATKLPEELGYQRQSHQRYVFLTQESPQNMYLNTFKYENYFNWTMSYLRNSDIQILYGRVGHKFQPRQRSTHRENRKATKYLAKKTASVVWMASNCETEGLRETYVKELRKYVDIDVFGACGNLTCSRDEHWISDPVCYDLIARKYKFYLSFENSLCPDYVSEKFFEILNHDLIPVVYGGANYRQLAPPHSFIDARQYTPRQLARLLHRLSSNETLYSEYFRWKEHYQVFNGPYQMIRNGFCDLCRKLHENSSRTVRNDITRLWSSTTCVDVVPWAYDSANVPNVFF